MEMKIREHAGAHPSVVVASVGNVSSRKWDQTISKIVSATTGAPMGKLCTP
ncbi:hypothetical protein CfE428DRAFT_6129 [Chthoniobacter flavus Ellin428]|uniref:Uncharacterized protein n=1 Tax=Chthoniobacter flavus Ellin428 TaxID=497964 RepID=B4DB38_9BACT|nr:hypothetical protein CfE428DRAFT_6129 [Chthoniobacter flavus Ellin428]